MTHLMQPRYKVIAPIPFLKNDTVINGAIEVGHVFTLSLQKNGQYGLEYKRTGWTGVYYDAYFNDYPANFRRLQWWEDRQPEEMLSVQYVKDKSSGKVYRVADPSQNGRIWHVDGEIEHRFITRGWYEPATLEEYNDHQTRHGGVK